MLTFIQLIVLLKMQNCEIGHGHFCLTTYDATLMKYTKYVNLTKMSTNAKLVELPYYNIYFVPIFIIIILILKFF